MPGAQLAAFRLRLRRWFDANQRAMPWRGTHNPYRIWLSEVMLQQTRVAAVVDYYRRFLRRFPTVRALARARESDVLRHWAGLGYYSRARNLHRAAKEIVARHGGRFPQEIAAALALPGVGRYTAAAVLSIAYHQPHAVLDGNVARVLARLGAVRGELRANGRWLKLQHSAQQLLNAHRSGDWNQAMMELGATVCTPRAPHCDVCPVARWCRARKLGIADQLPVARRKQSPVKITLAAAVLLDPRGRTLLVPPNGAAHDGLFSRMWQFPAIEGARNARSQLAALLLEAKNKRSTQGTQRGTEVTGTARTLIELRPARHAVTYREVTLQPYLARVARLPRISGAQTPRLDQLDALLISNATRKIAHRALEFLAQQGRTPLPIAPRGKETRV